MKENYGHYLSPKYGYSPITCVMANISEDQLDQLNRNLSQLSGTVGAMAAKLSADAKGRKEANDILRQDTKARSNVERNNRIDLQKTADEIRAAGKSASDFADAMREYARNIPGGFLMSEFLRYTNDTVSTYKEMSKYGQTFGGSMVKMSMAAGAAGLSLSDYSKAVSSNSKVVATLGQGFFAINKDVRRAAEGMGLYGMSLDEMNNFSGAYLEQQRLTGALTKAGQTRQVKAIGELAVSVGGLAKITGVATDQIMEIAQGAMRDPALVAAMAGNTARGMHAYNDEINKAVTQLAAQAGPAGKFLSEGLAQTIAMGGTQFTEQSNTMLEAGFSEGALAFQQAADKLARGVDSDQVSMELTNSLKQMADNPATREALLNQARAGNAQARQILEITQNLKTYTRAEMEAAKLATKRKDVMTGFATAFESIFSSLKGSLVEGFLSPFGKALEGTNFEKTLEDMKNFFKPLEATFADLGKSWGEGLKELLTGDNLKNFGNGIANVTKGLIDLFRIVFTKQNMDSAMAVFRLIADLGMIVSGFTMGVIVPVLGAVADGMNKFKGIIEGVMKFLSFDEKTSKTAAGVITGGLLIAAGLGLKVVFSKIAERFMGLSLQSVSINAGQVNINGGMGGGGGDVGGGGGGDLGGGDGGGEGERGNRRRGRGAGARSANRRMRAAERLARRREAARIASRTTRSARIVGGAADFGRRGLGMAGGLLGGASRGVGRAVAKEGLAGAAKAGGKTLLKKIPGIGLVSGLAFGAGRAMSGDWKGAGLELASGIAGTIPGLGTAASLGIDGLLMARDAGLTGGGGADKQSTARPKQAGGGRWKKMLLGMGLGAGALGIGGVAAAQAFGGPSTPPQAVDTQGQSDRMRDANRTSSQERSMENLLAEMRRMNATLDEGRQISTAQLERQIEQNNIARGTTTAIQDGRR